MWRFAVKENNSSRAKSVSRNQCENRVVRVSWEWRKKAKKWMWNRCFCVQYAQHIWPPSYRSITRVRVSSGARVISEAIRLYNQLSKSLNCEQVLSARMALRQRLTVYLSLPRTTFSIFYRCWESQYRLSGKYWASTSERAIRAHVYRLYSQTCLDRR